MIVGDRLDEASIYGWDGNYYGMAVTKGVWLEVSGNMVRVRPVQYTTIVEITRFVEVFWRILRL
jgi:hypothetical protein